MRAPHPDATPPPPLPPTTWHSGWRYRQPDDAARELQLIVQLDSAEDWGYVIAFTPLARWGLVLERAERARRLRVELTWTPPHAPPINITIAYTPDDMPTEGLREFARDWRRQAHRDDQPAGEHDRQLPRPPALVQAGPARPRPISITEAR